MGIEIVASQDLKLEPMLDDLGSVLDGILGMQAARGIVESDNELGLDIITMSPLTQFPLHTHEGHHILYILQGYGLIHYDGIDYPVNEKDSVFVPAIDPHGVKTDRNNPDKFVFLAIGYPHKHVASAERMTIVEGIDRSTRLEAL
mgnify:CR=1 FL=1